MPGRKSSAENESPCFRAPDPPRQSVVQSARKALHSEKRRFSAFAYRTVGKVKAIPAACVGSRLFTIDKSVVFDDQDTKKPAPLPRTVLRPQPPSYSLAYAELTGYIPDEQASREAEAEEAELMGLRVERERRLGLTGLPPTTRRETRVERNVLGVQVSSMDDAQHKALQRKADSMQSILCGGGRPSRLQKRRDAITGGGLSHLQVKSAVRWLAQKRPERMAYLNRVCQHNSEFCPIRAEAERIIGAAALIELADELRLPLDQLEMYLESFVRYDVDKSGRLDQQETRQMLSDFGLAPHSTEEKLELMEAMRHVDPEGLEEFDFQTLVRLLVLVRVRLEACQAGQLHVLFNLADEKGAEELDAEQAKSVLAQMGIVPRNEQERLALAESMQQVTHGKGGLSFTGLQEMLRRVRPRLTIERRKEEMQIAKRAGLNSQLFAEFRHHLPQINQLFLRLGGDPDNGRLDENQAFELTWTFGAVPRWDQKNLELVQAARLLCGTSNLDRKGFRLAEVVRLLHQVRELMMDTEEEKLLELFRCYDRDHSGELQTSELAQILQDLKMLPKSRQEQEEISTVIQELDVDGSGLMDFEEFQYFYREMSERLLRIEREAERQQLLRMRRVFDENEVLEIRRVFHVVDSRATGRVSMPGVAWIANAIGLAMSENALRGLVLAPHEDANTKFDFFRLLACVAQIEEYHEQLEVQEKGKLPPPPQ